jgi:hypothetical protein
VFFHRPAEWQDQSMNSTIFFLNFCGMTVLFNGHYNSAGQGGKASLAGPVISEVRGGWAFHFAGEFFFGFIPVRLIFSAFGDFG